MFSRITSSVYQKAGATEAHHKRAVHGALFGMAYAPASMFMRWWFAEPKCRDRDADYIAALTISEIGFWGGIGAITGSMGLFVFLQVAQVLPHMVRDALPGPAARGPDVKS